MKRHNKNEEWNNNQKPPKTRRLHWWILPILKNVCQPFLNFYKKIEEEGITWKENYSQMSLINIDAKLLHKNCQTGFNNT